MTEENQLFLKLELREIESKIKTAQSDAKISFKIWKDIDHFYNASLLEFKDGLFHMEELEILPHEDNYYFVSFCGFIRANIDS